MKNKIKTAFLLIAILLLISFSATSVVCGFSINWYSINSGGGLMQSASYKLNGSIGQHAAGYAESANLKHFIGFWISEKKDPIVVTKISDVKKLADDTLVSISGKISTTGLSDRFNGFMYIEEPDRSSGIRVSVPTWPVPGLDRGNVVNVVGKLLTTNDGERQVEGSVVIVSTSQPLKPLGMTNKHLGGGNLGTPPLGQLGVTGGFGLNNVGLLVKTWGRVVSNPGTGYVDIDDGSGVIVRVDISGLAINPPQNTYISVIGLSSLRKSSSNYYPLLLPRSVSDVTTH